MFTNDNFDLETHYGLIYQLMPCNITCHLLSLLLCNTFFFFFCFDLCNTNVYATMNRTGGGTRIK